MNCDCNKIGCESNKPWPVPRIKHVQGNVLRIAIPLTLRSLVKDGEEMVATDTDFVPSSDYPVSVVLSKGKTRYPLTATMDSNVAVIEDKGKIPIGTYDITVECRDDIGRPYRFKQVTVLQVVDKTAEAGIEEEIEYEATTWYLNAAVFLATTEIGSMSEEIDRKLEDVFGDASFDADRNAIRFYNKDRSRVLASIDATPFTADGSVEDVYIDVGRQVLVVVNNDAAGGRRFTVPLYLIFANYYNKSQIDNMLANIDVEGCAELDESFRLKYGQASAIVLDAIEYPEYEVEVGGTMIYGNSNGHIIKVAIGDASVKTTDLGIAPQLVFLNNEDNNFYRWNGTVWQQVGGSGSGGGGYSVAFDNGNVIFSGAIQPTYNNGNIIF